MQIKLVQGDTQLDPSKASTVAQSFASNGAILGVIGPAGSDEVQAVAPILKKAGLAFASGSATRVSLTDGSNRGFFFRDVPNDGVQGPTAVDYMTTKLGVKTGDTVMIVDDQESYSTGLADIVGAALTNNAIKNIKVDRESISQKATDFSSLVAKVNNNVKVVYLPFQLASQAQLFAQQLKAQGKTAIVFGSDGTFDSSKFNVDGSYISFFAPDVTTIPADAAVVGSFKKQFPGATSPFGAPNYVLGSDVRQRDHDVVQGRQDHPGGASKELRQGVADLDDPRNSDPIHGERRPFRRQVPHLQDRQRQVPDGPVARKRERGAAADAAAPLFLYVRALRMNWNLFVTELSPGSRTVASTR